MMNHHHSVLLPLKTRILYKSIENNISKPIVYQTRYCTNKNYITRHRTHQTTLYNMNLKSIYLTSRTINSIRNHSSSSHNGKHGAPFKNSVFRLSKNDTTELINKINSRIEEQYTDVKHRANCMVNSIKNKVNKSTSSITISPTVLFQSRSNNEKTSNRNEKIELDTLNSDVSTNEVEFYNVNQENEINKTNVNISNNSIEDKSLVCTGAVEEKNEKLETVKRLSLPSLEDIKSTSSYKTATSFTENTFKKAAQKTDNMTQELQETLISIKGKISGIPKIDHFAALQKLGSKTKSAAERNKELPSPQGEIYTLEDTLLKMGEMAGSQVNIVATAPNHSSTSDGKTTTSRMKKYLEQTISTVKKQENTQKKNLGKPQVSKASIDNRTKALSIGVRSAQTTAMKLLRVERLAEHLLQYPDSRHIAVKEGAIPSLLRMQKTWDKALLEHTHMCLALLGFVPNVRGRGLRVLSIDGGGARGVIPIEVLRELERRTNCRIQDLFDYIMGVSSGGVLAFLLTFGQSTLDECAEIYRQQSLEVFKRNSLIGTGKLFLNHAFYDTEGWTNILKTYPMATERMIEFSKDPTCPKVATVATLINQGALKDYLFRNYNLPAGASSRYQGSSSYHAWQALRASSAAPGYFEEHKLDEFIFQDGGVLTNNPCALALHECKLLWPNTPIQCVISVGTGRWDPQGSDVNQGFSTLKEKLVKIMLSATDTQSVHTIMKDLLPPKSYYRFNPNLSEDFDLDENRPEKLSMMENDILLYLEKHEEKMTDAVTALMKKKTPLQKATDWMNQCRILYQV